MASVDDNIKRVWSVKECAEVFGKRYLSLAFTLHIYSYDCNREICLESTLFLNTFLLERGSPTVDRIFVMLNFVSF